MHRFFKKKDEVCNWRLLHDKSDKELIHGSERDEEASDSNMCAWQLPLCRVLATVVQATCHA